MLKECSMSGRPRFPCGNKKQYAKALMDDEEEEEAEEEEEEDDDDVDDGGGGIDDSRQLHARPAACTRI